VQRLIEAKPILADMVTAGKLKVVGGVYDIATGKVSMV
jgi:carbonic anhydrase